MLSLIEVYGHGLIKGTYQMSFERWDMDIFFDWVRMGIDYRDHNRVIIRSDFHNIPAEESTKEVRFPIIWRFSEARYTAGGMSDWEAFIKGRFPRVLKVSSMCGDLLPPIITMLSIYPLSSLTVLSINTRLTVYTHVPMSSWVKLAENCPSIQQLTLSDIHEELMSLLGSRLDVWPTLTHLIFTRGLRKLGPLLETVVKRSTSHPFSLVEIHDYNQQTSLDEVKELMKDVNVDIVEVDMSYSQRSRISAVGR
jgi:hypothetical protein